MNIVKMIAAMGMVAGASLSFAHAHGGCSNPDLHDHMMSIKSELRSLSQDLKSDNVEGAGGHVKELIALFEATKKETPYLFKEQGLEGDALAKARSEYEEVVQGALDTLHTIDHEIESGNVDKVGAKLRDLGKHRKMGHSKFIVKC